MPRLVRQAPLSTRLQAYLDPWDWLLWLAEELNDDAYDEWLKIWAVPIGVGANIAFILARGASHSGRSSSWSGTDNVFADYESRGTGWLSWLATVIVYFLTAACCLNAVYTFIRKRNYRLFERPVDIAPETPSARRVKVDSSPVSSSPLRYLQNIISDTTASARAYPDAQREVWELSVWDPKPFNLTFFTYFSPGHLLVYYTLLPPKPLDPRPSVTIVMAMTFAALLSVQLSFLRSSFSQQAKDSSLIHGEVMNEYDTKFVRPSLNRPVRDVGTQTRESSLTPRGTKVREVDVYTPTTIINRGFRTNPNPNYAAYYDPNGAPPQQPDSSHRRQSLGPSLPRSATTPSLLTPTNHHIQTNGLSSAAPSAVSRASGAADFSSPLKPHHERLRERTPIKGDGGSMGVYSHAASPLRKAASAASLAAAVRSDRASLLRPDSPLKRASMPGGGFGADGSASLGGDGAAAARRRETGRY